MLKRVYDVIFAGLGLLLLWPALLLVAAAIKLVDGSPVFFRQTRMGLRGRTFKIIKFRTMNPGSEATGASVTRSGDPRVTTIGKLLRKLKLDELPQLWNVFVGEMSLVGPRPEVPRYVDLYSTEQREVLGLKPGITDLSTLLYRREEEFLKDAIDVERAYIQEIMPRKIELALAYGRNAGLWQDTILILRTLVPWVHLRTAAEKQKLPEIPPDLVMTLPIGVTLQRLGKFLLIYTFALTLSLWLAYELRFDFVIPTQEWSLLLYVMAGVVPVQLLCLYAFHQFHLLPAYFGVPALMRMVRAMSVSALALAVVRWRFQLGYALPFGVIVLDGLLSVVLLSSLCYCWRLYRLGHWSRVFERKGAGSKRRRRVAIVGVGNAGLALALELQSRPDLGFEPVAFFDDDPTKWRARPLNIPVAGPPELLAQGIGRSYGIEQVILSIPSASAARIGAILEILRQAGLEYKTVPSAAEMAMGRYQISHVRTVQIEDLLGREPISIQTDEIRRLLKGRRVMVTGAGGSIGSELARQVARFGAAELLLVERSEVQLFPIEQELIRRGHKEVIRPLIADILDEPRMRQIFDACRPHLVFHAAAHKHVPMMESQPAEAIQNNSFGTGLMARLSVEFEAERFVLISTDKAINPTSVMGASKRLAEMIVQDLQARNHTSTRLSAVRFGNVLGSSGSVVPLFKQQIAAGGPVTVTHPQMTRYFMTIPEAVGLVLESTIHGQGGEIFVLDMGKPVRIVDLAKQMIKLSGLEPEKDIKIEFTGTRPGEKLFEELSYTEEAVTRTPHPKVMRVRGAPPQAEDLRSHLQTLERVLHLADAVQLKTLLKKAVPEYHFSPAPVRNQPEQATRSRANGRSVASAPASTAVALP